MLSLHRLMRGCPAGAGATLRALVKAAPSGNASNVRSSITARLMYCTRAAAASVQQGEDIACTTAHGRVQMPLPLAQGTTIFSLTPHTDVAAVSGDIAREMNGGATADIYFETADGHRIAKSHLVGPLLKTGEFFLVVAGKRHRVQMPAEVVQSDSVEESMVQVQKIVRDLYTTLDGPRMSEVQQRRLEDDLEAMEAEAAPLLDKQKALVLKANRRANLVTWGGLAVMTLQFGFLYELSFNIFSWDLMEPVTYFVGYTQLLFFAAWHAICKQDYSYEGYHRRQYSIGFHKGAKRAGLDVDRLSFLVSKMEQLRAQLDALPQPQRRGHVTSDADASKGAA